MTLTQLITLNNESTYRELRADDGVKFGKELLGEYRPYSVRLDMAGADIILFNTHFISCMRQAMTEDCVARMSKLELKFWIEFVAYQNDIEDGTRDDNSLDITEIQGPLLRRELALESLNKWIHDELVGNRHEEDRECYVPYVEEQ